MTSCKSEDSTDEQKMDEFVQALEDEKNRPKYLELNQLLAADTVNLDSVKILMATGLNVNHTFEQEEQHEVARFGANNKLIRNFMKKTHKTVTVNVIYNPLHTLLENDPENKMEALLYLLSEGADPNLEIGKNVVPLETLIDRQMMYRANLGWSIRPNSNDPFTKGQKNRQKDYEENIEPYSMHFVDTLLKYGADAKQVDLSHADAEYLLLSKLLKNGADPETINVNMLIKEMWTYEDFEANDIFSYRLNYDSLDVTEMKLKSADLAEIEALKKSGLDLNRSFDGNYILGELILTSISGRNIERWIAAGAYKTSDQEENPLEFAQRNSDQVHDKVMSFLRDRYSRGN